jgi:hypothetical protein
VSTMMNLWVPFNVGKFMSSWATGSFSRRTQLHGVNSDDVNLYGSYVNGYQTCSLMFHSTVSIPRGPLSL